MTYMFPLPVQEQIANMHITNMHSKKVGATPLEVSALKKTYNALIQSANADGAKIYDCLVEYTFNDNCSEVQALAASIAMASIAQELVIEHNFQLLVEVKESGHRKISFLTTAVGMEYIFDAIHNETVNSGAINLGLDSYHARCRSFAMPLATSPAKQIIKDYGVKGFVSRALVVFEHWMFRDNVCRIFSKDTVKDVDGEKIQHSFFESGHPREGEKILPLDDAELFIKRQLKNKA